MIPVGRRWLVLAILTACGPSAGPGGEGGGDGGGASTAADDGPGGSDVGEAGPATGQGGDDDAVDEGVDDDTGPGTALPDCGLAIRLDLCCNQPFPATPDDIDVEGCVAPWPVDFEALPEGILDGCAQLQPEFCEIVDCDYAPVASDVVDFDAEGVCAWVCPEGESLGYQQPGCGTPPPVVECLLPPPPCAMDYCSCEGETIVGCGVLSEPWESEGACR